MARKKIIPKRIGNVKVPKNLRKLGDQVLSDPRAREVAGKALLAVGTALVARNVRPGSVFRDIFDPPPEGARTAKAAGGEAAQKAGEAVSGMADAVGQVVGEVFDTIRRDFARKVRPVRPRHAHDDEPEDRPEADDSKMH